MNDFLRRHPLLLPIGSLLLSSLVGLALLAGRLAISRHLHHLYLPWNLFLAWVPLIVALVARALARSPKARGWPFLVASVTWLLFLPNAPYLITDLVHLPNQLYRHYWADMMLIIHFALTGLVLGFLSLHVMHAALAKRYGWWRGWGLIGAASALCGLGIYIGRFLRWNTWDVLCNPWNLVVDLGRWAFSLPNHPSEIVLTLLFSVVPFLAYLVFVSFFRPSPEATD